jgi:hypothetical protein
LDWIFWENEFQFLANSTQHWHEILVFVNIRQLLSQSQKKYQEIKDFLLVEIYQGAQVGD